MMKGLLVAGLGLFIIVVGIVIAVVGFNVSLDEELPDDDPVHVLDCDPGVVQTIHMVPGSYEVWYDASEGEPTGLLIVDRDGNEVYDYADSTDGKQLVAMTDKNWKNRGGFEITREDDYNATCDNNVTVYITNVLNADGRDDNLMVLLCCGGTGGMILGVVIIIVGIIISIIEFIMSARRGAWKEFAEDIGAEYEKRGFIMGDRVKLKHDKWEIILSPLQKDRKQNTRITAIYRNRTDFSWTVHSRTWAMNLQDSLRVDKDPVVYKNFHPDYVIRSNDPEMARELFSDRRIKGIITTQPDIYLSSHWRVVYIDKLPKGKKELFFFKRGIIKDKERLWALFNLFMYVLPKLEQLDRDYYAGGKKKSGTQVHPSSKHKSSKKRSKKKGRPMGVPPKKFEDEDEWFEDDY